jgi:hypothetical protein
LDKDYEIWVSKKQDNESELGDPFGDDDSDTTINMLMSKETDLTSKLYPSYMKFYNEMKRLKSLFNSKASNVME